MDKEDVVHIYKNEIFSFATTWMDLESIMESKLSQTMAYTKTSTLCSLLYVKPKKTNEQTKQNETISDTENK